ncbi:hypothetical protein T07_11477 [Trichinella nelsoni]|uniref:Uncharacterized protein n=1 Tax=Trichinella nelsoni TaxID=6336 RepID=A0A0V0RPQ0_9BILA|nr:hypothetical protein T07_11477 [Trichinella nelsoni]
MIVDWEHVSAICGVGALMPNWPHLCRLTGEEQKWIYSPTETMGLTLLSSIKASLNSSKESIDYILSASFADCAKNTSLLDEHQQQSQTINLPPHCASREELEDQILFNCVSVGCQWKLSEKSVPVNYKNIPYSQFEADESYHAFTFCLQNVPATLHLIVVYNPDLEF